MAKSVDKDYSWLGPIVMGQACSALPTEMAVEEYLHTCGGSFVRWSYLCTVCTCFCPKPLPGSVVVATRAVCAFTHCAKCLHRRIEQTKDNNC